MNMRGLDDKSIAIVINSLVISLAQFAALESNISIEDCNLIDRTIINKIRKGYSLAKNDMKDIMFVSHQKMGMNVRSFLGTMLAAKARELECGLNGEMQYCASFRARWQAWVNREESTEKRDPFDYLQHGLIESNVRFLARYGIYLRDKKHHLCNIIIDLLAHDVLTKKIKMRKKYGGPVGDHRFRKSTTGVLGESDDKLIDFSSQSPLHNEVRAHMEKCERNVAFPDWSTTSTWDFKKVELKKYNVSSTMLAEYATRAIEIIRTDTIATYQVAQWQGEKKFTTEPPTNAMEWAIETKQWLQPLAPSYSNRIKMDTTQYEEEIRRKMVEHVRIDGVEKQKKEEYINLWSISYGDENEEEENFEESLGDKETYKRMRDKEVYENGAIPMEYENGVNEAKIERGELIRKYFEMKGCPYFTADDGGRFNKREHGEDRGAKATILWAPYMAENETFEDIIDIWQTRKAVPFLARVGCMPHQIGTEVTNCGHMELGALNSDFEMLGANDPCLHLLDSNATAFAARAMRDDPTPTMRTIPFDIRVTLSGISRKKRGAIKLVPPGTSKLVKHAQS
jgi:hypothetical protein